MRYKQLHAPVLRPRVFGVDLGDAFQAPWTPDVADNTQRYMLGVPNAWHGDPRALLDLQLSLSKSNDLSSSGLLCQTGGVDQYRGATRQGTIKSIRAGVATLCRRALAKCSA